jgi:uncharacterized RDD family membrane protein YckC
MSTQMLWVYVLIVLSVPTVGIARRGQSPGMRVNRVEVTRADGSPLGWWRAAIRTAIALGWFVVGPLLPLSLSAGPAGVVIEWVPILWLLAVFGPILGREGLGLHDRAVGSVVRRRA